MDIILAPHVTALYILNTSDGQPRNIEVTVIFFSEIEFLEVVY